LCSHSLTLSLLFLTNEKREKESCCKNYHKIIVQISLLFAMERLVAVS